MTHFTFLALIGGMQISELIFILALFAGVIALVGGVFYLIIRAAVRAGIKSAAKDSPPKNP